MITPTHRQNHANVKRHHEHW